MKRFHAALLAAAVSAGVPALAYAQAAPQDQGDHSHDGNPRGDRAAPPQGQRPERGERPAAQAPAAPQAQPRASQPQAQLQGQNYHNQDVSRQPMPQGGPGGFQGRNDGRQPGGPDGRGQGYDNRRGPQDGQRAGGPDFRGQGYDDRRGSPQGGPGRPGFAPNWGGGRPGYDRPGGGGPDWRQDRRYDWRGYRDQNRDLFRARPYIAPRGWGWGYRPLDRGFRLPPFLFGSQYWIADPWAYRLPPVEGPYRWVRYYNDVLLIDLRSGEIVDEIPGFFW